MAPQPAAPVTPRSILVGGQATLTKPNSTRTPESVVTECVQEPAPEYEVMHNSLNSNVAVPRGAVSPPVSFEGQGTAAVGSSLGGAIESEGTLLDSMESRSMGVDQGMRKAPGLEPTGVEMTPDMEHDCRRRDMTEVVVAEEMPPAGGVMHVDGVFATPEVAENGIKDLEVEPPCQLVAPIEKPADVVAKDVPRDSPAVPELAPAPTNARKSYAQAVLSSTTARSDSQPPPNVGKPVHAPPGAPQPVAAAVEEPSSNQVRIPSKE